MDKKKCNKCLKIKPVSLFGKESRAKNGYKTRCKKCNNEDLYLWRLKNPEIFSEHLKSYYNNNKQKIKDRNKKYYLKNIEKKKEYNKNYREKNIEKINQKTLEYVKDKIEKDPDFRLTRAHRKLIYRLKIEKRGNTSFMLGYTKDDLLNHLGRYPNKNENIDHKIPVSWFKDKSDFKLINDLRNLHIISRYENIKKNNKYCHDVDQDYYKEVFNKVKEEYKQKIKWK